MDSDEEERLRRWKEHLASQQDTDDEAVSDGEGEDGDSGVDGSQENATAKVSAHVGWANEVSTNGSPSAAAGNSGGASARRRARDEGGSVAGTNSDSIDWSTTLMPEMREIKQENQLLARKVRQQEMELAALRGDPRNGASDALRPTSGLRDAKEAKIVELAKKCRTLTVALEKERAKGGRMAAEITRLSSEVEETRKGRDLSGMDARSLPMGAGGNKETKKQGTKQGGDDAEEETVTVEAKLKELQGKMAGMNSALNAQRVANDSLKLECGRLREALKRELGDVSIDKALEEGSGWTGRAQQMSLLQSKVTQLKRELASAREAARGTPQDGPPAAPSSPQQMDAAWRLEEQRRRELDKIERERRREAEGATEELERVRAERDAIKKKLDAAVSRVKNVERDCKDLRDKVAVLLAKTDNDDGLIAALQNEMQAMARRSKEERRRDKEQQSAGEAQDLRAELRDKEAQIERQHKIIVSLRAEAQAASVRRDGEQREALARGAEAIRANAQVYKTKVGEVQLSKAEEVIELLKRKLAEGEERLHACTTSLRKEKQRCVELERKAENKPQGMSGRRANSAPGGYPPEKVEMLVDRLNNLTDEMESLQDSFRRTLQVKEEELRYNKDLVRHLQQQLEEGQQTLERQLDQLISRA